MCIKPAETTSSDARPTSTPTSASETGKVSGDSVNIYARPSFLPSQNGASAPFVNGLQGQTVLPSVRDFVDLTGAKEHHIDALQECSDIKDVKSRSEDCPNDNNTMLIFDLTASGCLISSGQSDSTVSSNPSESSESSSKDIYRVHLSLPSTLVKRPKYHFEKLLQSVIDDSKRLKLMSLIDDCNTFLFYDGCSKMNHCLLPTYWLIKKFGDFLHDKICKSNIKLYILEKMERSNGRDFVGPLIKDNNTASVPTGAKTPSDGRPNKGGPKKLNLTIKILPKSTDKMFIQSIKKDTIHYSPNSLKRYFKLSIPEELEDDDPVLPKWLKQFSKRDESDSTLQKLLEKFEYLENLELNRLERGLTTNGKTQDCSKLQDSDSYHKIYSLSNLQREFAGEGKLSRQHSRSTSPCGSDGLLKITIPKEQPTSLNGSNRQGEASNKSPNSSVPSAHTDSDTESLLTPMGNYAVSQGIQSFSKNRYSNILPYEHSRVKLQPSPIHGLANGCDSPSVSGQMGSNGNTPGENGMQRKRRNSNSSYFNQNFGEPHTQRPNDNRNIPGAAAKDTFNDYFNANYLKLPQVNLDLNYIATQAPLPSTIDDFWKVISTNNVKVIISLNSNDELFLRKWDIYWNNDRSGQKYRIDIMETFENCCNVDGCILRIFSFYKNQDEDNESKKLTVYQLQYTKWLDSCGIVMQDILSLYTIKNMLLNKPARILSDLREGNAKDAIEYAADSWPESAGKSKAFHKQPPLLVHCSAGCGRTGVFITLDFLLNVLTSPANSSNRIDVWNMSEDLIFIIINELRKQRISMVQNLTQYITCYESLLQYFALRKQRKDGV